MVFSENFFGSGASPSNPNGPNSGPGPDPGRHIGSSLRFRGSQYLTRDNLSASETTTFAAWFKLGKVSTDSIPLSQAGGGVNQLIFNATGTITGDGTASQNCTTSSVYRDPSAWYHLLYTRGENATRLFINGEETPYGTFVTGAGTPISSGTLALGAVNSVNSLYYEGYMADVYFIDGQQLEPNVFGRYNEANVWVPITPNFGIGQTRYSDLVTSSTGSWFAGHDPTKMFDGITDGTDTQTSTADGELTWQNFEIDITSSLVIYRNPGYGDATLTYTIDGVDQTFTLQALSGSPGQTVFSGSGTLTKIVCSGGGSYGGSIAAIEIDGVIVTDPYLWSTGVTLIADPPGQFDHPVQNMFDGDTSTNCIGNTSGQTISWVPPQPITFNQSVEIWTSSADGTNTISLLFGGTEIASVPCLANAWTTVATGSDTFDNLRIFGPGTDARVSAVRIDGQIYVDGKNQSYGPNGFHLDFSDPNDVGADRSGNGNHFTATGFDFSPTGSFSTQLTATMPGSYVADKSSRTLQVLNPHQAFDGNLAAQAQANTGGVGGGWLYWNTSIACNTVTIVVNNQESYRPVTIYINGTSVTVPTAVLIGSNYETEVPVPGGILNELAFMNDGSGGNTSIFGMRINGGAPLEDNVGDTYDLMQDSPTQNYATWNSVIPPSTGTANDPTDANLTLRGASGFTIEKPLGETIYFEMNTGYISNGRNWSSWWNVIQILNGQNQDISGGGNNVAPQSMLLNGGFAFDISANVYANNIDEQVEINSTNLAADDIIGVELSDTNITIYINGVASSGVNNLALANSFDNGMYIYARNASGASSTSEFMHINFGQKPFLQTPPEGAVTLQTANLPESSIPDGREEFQVFTAGGDAIFSGAIYSDNVNTTDGAVPNTLSTTFGGSNRGNCVNGDISNKTLSGNPAGSFIIFRPDKPIENVTSLRIYVEQNYLTAAWVNDSQIDLTGKVNSGTVGWVDITPDATPFTLTSIADKGSVSPAAQATLYAIEINGVILQGGLLDQVQQEVPYGLWWIKDRANSNQHQLLDSVRGGNLALQTPATGAETTYVAPSGDSVAWCWNAGDATVANSNGSIASQVSANTDAGFSIVSYTGNFTAGATVGHGLGDTPDMIIVKGRDFSDEWHVKHVGIGNNSNSLRLNSNAASADFNAWNNTAPDSSVFTLGPINGTNKLGSAFIAYCWHSVPGYSAFGAYGGNQSDDGVFVHLGFRPAWVMIKNSNTGPWMIFDSTRSTYNNDTGLSQLKAESTDSEIQQSQNNLDFLSNGFKIRGNGGNINGEADKLYVAFAENPFSAPVTAR